MRAFPDPRLFRSWLQRHHDTANELVVRCYKQAQAGRGMTYRQALDEALCFGWIDGVRGSVDAHSFTVRFTPRQAGSVWSRVNLRRARELQVEGRLHPPGVAALRRRRVSPYSYESRPQALPPSMMKRLRHEASAWNFFRLQPQGYQRTAVYWVMSAKRAKTREARFGILRSSSQQGLRIPLLRRETVTRAHPRTRKG
jgi:uncharacterized protein YdeI (YjbR/CyaY-like superfamily)